MLAFTKQTVDRVTELQLGTVCVAPVQQLNLRKFNVTCVMPILRRTLRKRWSVYSSYRTDVCATFETCSSIHKQDVEMLGPDYKVTTLFTYQITRTYIIFSLDAKNSFIS